jgi:hypothetical protein
MYLRTPRVQRNDLVPGPTNPRIQCAGPHANLYGGPQVRHSDYVGAHTMPKQCRFLRPRAPPASFWGNAISRVGLPHWQARDPWWTRSTAKAAR